MLGRGASDNKGGLVGVLAALAAVMQSHGGLPVNVKYITEGQEEVGSPGMEAWMRQGLATRSRFTSALLFAPVHTRRRLLFLGLQLVSVAPKP